MAMLSPSQLLEIIGAQHVENMVLQNEIQSLRSALQAGCQRECCNQEDQGEE